VSRCVDRANSEYLHYDESVPVVNRIANYVPERLLASAGMVDTFLARAKDVDRVVALKVLFLDRVGGARAKAAAQRFLAAGRRALEFSTPGTARVLDVSDELEAAFVATEVASGVDLAGLADLAAKRGRRPGAGLDPVVAGLICAEVAETVARAHAHSPPLFHLGLCPGNVVVAPTAEVTLLDVGLSASLRQEGLLPLDKWRFVAPEVARTDAWTLSSEAAIAVDLYALGVLLHFLLTGRLPGPVASLSELSKRRGDAFPEVDGAPAHLRAAVRALTAADPRDRPDSAHTVVTWLSNGVESKADRQACIAVALRAMEGSPAGAFDVVRPALAAKQAAPAQVAPDRGSAVASARRRGTRGILPVLLTAFVVAAGGIALWTTLRSRPRPPGKVMPKSEPRTARTPSLKLGQPEIPAPAPPDGGARAALPAQPSDRVYMPGPKQKLPRVPGHLFLATNPDKADVWVDGELRGKTPVDLVIGRGGHRVVVIKPGHHLLRVVYDTTEGEYVRKDLQRVAAPTVGDAFLDVECPEANRYPVFLDDEETGLLCPVAKLPVTSGKHSVGIFVPSKRTVVAVEVVARRGGQPVRVTLKD
jgi:serine/threonine protein kinase